SPPAGRRAARWPCLRTPCRPRRRRSNPQGCRGEDRNGGGRAVGQEYEETRQRPIISLASWVSTAIPRVPAPGFTSVQPLTTIETPTYDGLFVESESSDSRPLR